MTTDDPVYENILANVASGVVAVDASGRVTCFNAAAEAILGLRAADVLGRSIGEVLFEATGFDELTDAVVDAVHHAALSRQRVATVRAGGAERSLSVSTTYLGDRGTAPGSGGVVAVFEDITEVKELRESELRLAREARERQAELEKAYGGLELRNRELGDAARRLALVRWLATGVVVALFVGAGIHFWGADPGIPDAPRAAPAGAPAGSTRTVTIVPGPLRSHVTVRGRLEPLRSLAINSPFPGTVKAVHFEYGQQVEKGDALLELDTSRIAGELRQARIDHVTAEQARRRLGDASLNTGVSGARLAVNRARIGLALAKEELEELRFLLDRGIIPADRYAAKSRALEEQETNLRLAETNLEITLEDNKTREMVAELALDNATTRLRELEESIAGAVVRAPVSGVVLRATGDSRTGEASGGARTGEGALAVGETVPAGARLLTIGDLTGLSIASGADEIDIGSIVEGLPVRVTGDGFRGIVLHGEIAHVSSQASGQGSGARFDLTAEVPRLSREHRRVLRVGMSARLDVVTYERTDALLVPLGAVDASADPPTVRVAGETGMREVAVRTGLTTLDSVEIVDGLEPGDVLVVDDG